MKIGVVTSAFNRPKIDKAYCLMMDRLRNDYPDLFLPVVVISQEADRRVFEEHGFEIHVHENKPLGAKHNFMISTVRGRVSHVLHFGSDNIVDNKFIDKLVSCAHRDIVWARGLIIYCSKHKTARYWESVYMHISGPGRLIKADILDAMEWTPWRTDKERGLDYSCHKKIELRAKNKEAFLFKDYGGLLVDIKSDQNINSYHAFRNSGVSLDPEYIYQRLPEVEGDYLKSL